MTSGPDLPDAAERRSALDPSRSFIVQAPAGSGKTELLIQRFLRLLACVDQPEEVMAVTFTRKAAGEMRSRVIAALRQAADGLPPEAPHLRLSYELACEVVGDEARREWQLHRHPARLSIGTIDSVNAWLVGRAPVTCGGSGLRVIAEAPQRLYQQAAQATLAMVGEGEDGAAIAALLRHLDNDAARFERLIISMLPRRDQWLRQVLTVPTERSRMEQPLRELVTHGLRQVAEAMEPAFGAELAGLLAYAGRQLRDGGTDSPLVDWVGRTDLPPPAPEALGLWQSLAAALLTTDKGAWRRSVDVRNGFPPRTPEKRQMQELLEACVQREELRQRLLDLQALPDASYTDEQWVILRVLLDVLRLAAAQLQLVFADAGECDFAEVAASALRALGGSNEPSDLGLALDHRIRHLLVDEFQDTSWSQFELLERLTAGWQPGDGHSLFVVGDPMQSIYRFREADVGIFMRVRDDGIGDIRPVFLRLSANFRSLPGIVEWTNDVFAASFPGSDDPLVGAVSYAPSNPARAPAPTPARVAWHWLPAGDDHAEDQRVLAIVSEARSRRPEERVCILVRSRAHAGRILGALRAAGIAFVAPELENMERASVAQDLLALTRAIVHPADRLAWIGVLRAPWCGLSLVDLYTLLGGDHRRPVIDILADETLTSALSGAGAAAIARLRLTLARAARVRGRRSLRDLVEGAWLDLAGPATVREPGELETADAFLQLLETFDTGGDCADPVVLGEEMRKRQGSLGSGDPGVQVMTMHKAKGLEFDTVILPGLGKRTRGDDQPLLAWQQVALGGGRSAPVLSPMAPTGSDGDPLYRYLMHIEQEKNCAEAIRLLYVACTRARNHLHLCAQLQSGADPKTGEIHVRQPRAGSLLSRIWPAVAAEAEAHAHRFPMSGEDKRDEPVWVQPPLRRFRQDFHPPRSPPPCRPESTSEGLAAPALEYEWAGGWTMQAGSVVHRWLQIIAEQGLAAFDRPQLLSLQPRFRRQLEQLGTAPADLDRAAERVVAALCRATTDERGRWILSGDHAHAESELALVVSEGGLFRQLVIDRTFVTADGTRWIIDYKTSTHEGGDLDAFLASESERHAGQLHRYRDALAALKAEPIRTALYYPLLAVFREIDAAAPASG